MNTKPIQTVLIANRGEIACRIIKTLRMLGIRSIAVYSDADREALHVKLADEAVYIGEAPSISSYLDQEKIIKVAKEKAVDAIHPGYGFLSENPVFAQKLENAAIRLIGPSALSMQIMGNKLAAKEAVKHYNIPLVPGTDYSLTDPAECIRIANEIGYPILIKAAAGGGGKGMRLVYHSEDMAEQLNMAMGESLSAFGDSSVFIEKYVDKPRHIEFQILGDMLGNIVHLFERECSIQRRHQKVVEEAPSAILDDKLRSDMGAAAVKVAKACNYVGAGTVEFLVDSNRNFYFLEMNTRLQVEHAITEMITGLDLVEWQVKIAEGQPLGFRQDDLKINGHAIELRVYAEDPLNNFLPSIGLLTTYKIPHGESIRVDNGIEEGMEVPIYYDPMLSKLICHGRNRQAAISKMKDAIQSYDVVGIETTLSFGNFVMNHPSFVNADFDTSFVKMNFSNETFDDQQLEVAEVGAAFLHLWQTKHN
jgi:pyruvate carboxylase subunit A